ncbi:MAG: Wadjet anti-phage system protein JetD domain-containing protein [Agriterribacter sp.]
MIPPYLLQLQRSYKSYLKNLVAGNAFTAIVLRGEKNKPATTVDLHKAIQLFQQNEKREGNKGWTIEWTDWSNKKLGKQKWPAQIIVTTESDYLFLLGKEKEADEFKQQLESLLIWQPRIQSFLLEKPEQVLALKDAWKDIQKVVDFLLQTDVSNYYIRNIPVPVHTKFIETYKPVITAILRSIAPEKFPSRGNNLEQMLMLKIKPHLYPVRWLDANLSVTHMHGMEVTGVTVEWLQKLNWSINEVWLVENETNLYLIPERKNAVAIFSKGNATHSLKEIPLLKNATLYYWGDLDEEGFKMMHAMRGFYPHIISVFMDSHTLLQHADEFDKQKTTYVTTELPLLTPDESAAFNILKHHNGRLEQERIRQEFMMRKLLEM